VPPELGDEHEAASRDDIGEPSGALEGPGDDVERAFVGVRAVDRDVLVAAGFGLDVAQTGVERDAGSSEQPHGGSSPAGAPQPIGWAERQD
jgi:hypothetical protein